MKSIKTTLQSYHAERERRAILQNGRKSELRRWKNNGCLLSIEQARVVNANLRVRATNTVLHTLDFGETQSTH